MVVIDTCQRHTSPDKREHIATVCALCVWIIILAFCWVFLTTEHFVEDFGSAVACLLMLPFVVVILTISSYKIGKAILKLYKYRRELRR